MRLTCCSSASTWAKSVLYVKSAVRFCVTPYFDVEPDVRRSRSFETSGRGAAIGRQVGDRVRLDLQVSRARGRLESHDRRGQRRLVEPMLSRAQPACA